MKIFQCPQCSHPVYFENTLCLKCGSSLGFLGSRQEMILIDGNSYAADPNYRYCANYYQHACNWMVRKDDPIELCQACNLNRTIPDLSIPEHVGKWQKLEVAKHRLVYSLLKLNVDLNAANNARVPGLAFDFLSHHSGNQHKKVMTGYLNGLITINLDEADNVHREYIREKFSEPYRTLIGHFRHETGHYFWEKIIRENDQKLAQFRWLFGDDTRDYNQALQAYYNRKAGFQWQHQYISEYASSHPLEDWAETWAHYLHVMDTLETAFYFGMVLRPKLDDNTSMSMSSDFDPYTEKDFKRIIDAWLPMTYAVNSINRSMGLQDLYPFVISEQVLNKLSFVHNALLDFRQV